MPKISIIVPIYNVEKYFSRCMDSLLNQTLKDIEIILVDDGSPDNCPAMCDEYAKQDPRIKVIHKKNAGLGFARNSGIEIATGEYIAFVDSDDDISVRMYEKLYERLSEDDYDIVSCGVNVNRNGSISQEHTNDRVIIGDEVKYYLAGMIASDVSVLKERQNPMAVWHAIYKREILEVNNIRFLSEREVLSEDIVFDICFIPLCKKIRLIPDALYNYYHNEGSLTKVFKTQKIKTNVALYHELNNRMISGGLYFLKNRIMRFFIGYTRSQLRQVILSELPIREKKKICTEIYELDEWKKIFADYPIHQMPVIHRWFLLTIKHKLFYCQLIMFKYISHNR